MNETDINNYQIKCAEEPKEVKCNCEQFEQIDNIPVEFGPKKDAKCQSQLRKISKDNNQKPKTVKEESKKDVKLKLKEISEKEVDPVDEFLKNRRNFPISLIRQYYPKTEGYTFDLLPLPFLQNLRSCEIRNNSVKNEVNQKPWKDFIHRLPESQYEMALKPIDKYWRWKMYKKYVPEERTYFRKTMATGPKLDQLGRPPMPAEELNKFRVCRANILTPERFKTFLKKGDGHKKLAQKNKTKI